MRVRVEIRQGALYNVQRATCNVNALDLEREEM